MTPTLSLATTIQADRRAAAERHRIMKALRPSGPVGVHLRFRLLPKARQATGRSTSATAEPGTRGRELATSFG
jgi:hypothetical protein